MCSENREIVDNKENSYYEKKMKMIGIVWYESLSR